MWRSPHDALLVRGMSSCDAKRLDMIVVSTREDSADDQRDLRYGDSDRVDVGRDNSDMNTESAVPSVSPSGEIGDDENTEIKQFYNEIINEIELVQSKIDSMKDLRDIYDENECSMHICILNAGLHF